MDETLIEPTPDESSPAASIRAAPRGPAGPTPAWMEWMGAGAAIAATFVGAFLSFLHLSEDSFWVDEGSTVMIADQPFSETWRLLITQELNGSPYFLLMHLWLEIGRSEMFVRSLSVIFAVATIPLVYAIGRKLFHPLAGAAAALLLSVNGYFISNAQEARQYSFALFTSTLATYLLIIGIERRRTWIWVSYALVGAISVYAHLFGAFIMFGHLVSLVARRWRDLPWKQMLASYASMGLLLIPLALFVANNDRGQIDWVPEPSPELLRRSFDAITGFAGPQMLWAYAGAGALAVVAMTVSLIREGRSERSWGYIVCFFWFLAPIFISYAISFTKPIFYPRYIIVAVAALPLIAGGALTFIRPRLIAPVAALVLLWLALPGIGAHYEAGKADWREVTRFVIANARPGDAVIFYSPTGRRPFEYYISLAGADLSDLPQPVHPPTPFGRYDTDTFLDYMPKGTSPAEFTDVGRDFERVWLLLSKRGSGPPPKRVMQAVASRCPDVFRRHFRGIRLRLMQGCQDGSRR
jgi:mannosyltransferase